MGQDLEGPKAAKFAYNLKRICQKKGIDSLPIETMPKEIFSAIIKGEQVHRIDAAHASNVAKTVGTPVEILCKGVLIREPEQFKTVNRNKFDAVEHAVRFTVNLATLKWFDAFYDGRNLLKVAKTSEPEELGWIWVHSAMALTVAQITRELSENLVAFEDESGIKVDCPELTSLSLIHI